jgi:hypothetical protein
VVDVEEAEGDGEEDSVLGEAGVSFSCGQCGKRLLRETSGWLDDRLTVGERKRRTLPSPSIPVSCGETTPTTARC